MCRAGVLKRYSLGQQKLTYPNSFVLSRRNTDVAMLEPWLLQVFSVIAGGEEEVEDDVPV